jgi:hypothetical protein
VYCFCFCFSFYFFSIVFVFVFVFTSFLTCSFVSFFPFQELERLFETLEIDSRPSAACGYVANVLSELKIRRVKDTNRILQRKRQLARDQAEERRLRVEYEQQRDALEAAFKRQHTEQTERVNRQKLCLAKTIEWTQPKRGSSSQAPSSSTQDPTQAP